MASCNIEVNFNVQPGETIMYCPYFQNHYFRETRAHYHLNNCRRQYEIEKKKLGQEMDIMVCPLSYKHHIPNKDWANHLESCFDVGKKELSDVCNVTLEEEEAAKNLGPNCFMVPGTREVIQMNAPKTQSKYDMPRHDWEVMKDRDSTETERLRRVPGLIGIDTRVPAPVKEKPAAPSYVRSHMDRAFKVGGQPIGLTKSEKKRWQEANMEKVKKEMKEEEARALFRRLNNMNDSDLV